MCSKLSKTYQGHKKAQNYCYLLDLHVHVHLSHISLSVSLSLTRSLKSLLVCCLKEIVGYELLKLFTLIGEVRVGEGMVEKLLIN